MEPPADPDERHERAPGPSSGVGALRGAEFAGGDTGTGASGRPPSPPNGDDTWAGFHDHLDSAVGALAAKDCLDLISATAPWRIRIQAGWPGVEGPGSLAYHLQLGGDRDGTLGPWSETPYARTLGFAATRVAGSVSAFGLESDRDGMANPTMIASGTIGGLEIADLTVELLREALEVHSIADVSIVDTPSAAIDIETARRDRATVDGGSWWSELDFDSVPEVSENGAHVVGWMGDVLVEVIVDPHSLPGLMATVARARLTDPHASALTLPSGTVMSLMRRMRGVATNELTIEPVTGRGHLVHTWVQRTVVAAQSSDPNAPCPTRGAVDDVVGCVHRARRSDPDVLRPTRMVIRLGD